MEYNDREGKYLIKLLKAVLNNEIPVPPPKDLDWPELYKLAKYHSISNIVYYAIMKLDNSNRPSEKVFKAFEQDMNIAKAREALQHFALEDVLKAYESECVKCMPLKGTIIKYLYPQPDMRSMSDIDILFEKSDRDKVKKILNSQGYKLYEKGPNHDIYIKGMIVIEMHYDLFMKSISLYDYFKAFLYRGQKKEGHNYIYESNKEDCYIYIVAHLLKHYSEYAGTGIRSFIDLWVYKNYYKEQLNKTYLNQEFSKLGISEFVDNIEGLSDMWFSGCIEPGSDADIVIYDPSVEETISKDNQIQNVDYAPFEGTPVQGKIDKVFLRGNLVVDNGKIYREGAGEFVKRDRVKIL